MFKKVFVFLLLSKKTFAVSKENVIFYLYDQLTDKPIPIDVDNPFQTINPSNPTKMIIHGWHNNPTEEAWITRMSSLYHKKENSNVIVVDWSKDAAKNYIHAASVARSVGSIVGDFIAETHLEYLHIIGHSLGAQVAGSAGQRVYKKTKKKVDRVTGLDAAGLFFEKNTKDFHLDKSDASFVDMIHTAALGVIGYMGALGTVDFFVNNGISQLNCSENLPNVHDAVSCDHKSAHFYFAETILEPKKYEGVSCESKSMLDSGLCDGNPTAYMGEGVSTDARGTYYVNIDENGDPSDE